MAFGQKAETIDVSLFISSHRRCSIRKGVLKNSVRFTGKHLCQRLFLNKFAGLSLSLPQVFSCEFCEISKNAIFTEPFRAIASDYWR